MRLTEKQLNSAVEAMEEVWDRNSMPVPFEDMARAAYPYLAQWDEPTESEIIDIQDMWLPDLSGIPRTIIACILTSFVRSRNAALLKPQPNKKATMPEIVVPEGMLKAAIAGCKNCPAGGIYVQYGLEPALRWLLAEIEKLRRPGDIGRAVALDDVLRMFAPPVDPLPVDPRREKIEKIVLSAFPSASRGLPEAVAKDILAVLEEK